MSDFFIVVERKGKRRFQIAKLAVFLALAGLTICKAALGGPFPPQNKSGVLPAPAHLLPLPSGGPHTAFEEISPLIESVEIKKGNPFVEIFVKGYGHLDCYDVREFQVERTSHSTQIIPRLRRMNPSKPCKLGIKSFYDKAADLDPSSPSTEIIEVLGYRGWLRRNLKPL